MKITVEIKTKEIAELMAATTSTAKNKEILQRQLELLSKASEKNRYTNLMPALTHAMTELYPLL